MVKGDVPARPFLEMNFKVLLKPGKLDDSWVAVCLDRYVVAQGKTQEAAMIELIQTLDSEIRLGLERGQTEDPLQGITPAPTEYWDMYTVARKGRSSKIKKLTPKHSKLTPQIENRIAAAV